jgi:hypothetical protein
LIQIDTTMTGFSIASALLAPINKLRGKTNPYQKQYQSTNPATSNEFLAEARQAAGRDPVTGHQYPTNTPTSSDLLAEARQAAGRNPVTGLPQPDTTSKKARKQKLSLEQQQQAAAEQKAAFLAWAARHPQAAGRPYESYEAFVQEMVAKRTGNVVPQGGTGYYAPERNVEEYYSQGVRD